MTLVVSVPGRDDLHLEHLLLDVNGTLTDRGQLLDGVQVRIQRLHTVLSVRVVSADTFGTLDEVAEQLGRAEVARVSTGEEKAQLTEHLGPHRCAAIGNGANDELMLATAGLGIAILGPEGASPRTMAAADLVSPAIIDALDLLLEPKALAASLRA